MTSTINSQDRVRQNTAVSVNQNIDEAIAKQIQDYSHRSEPEISQRIQQLQREWDTERVLELNASILAFIGLILGVFVNQNWFWLTGIVLPFLAQHAIQGWCPPLPVIRRLGVRTRNEINQERYALKALRGDFDPIPSLNQADVPTRTTAILKSFEIPTL